MNRATIGRPSLRPLSEAFAQFRDRVAAAEIGRRLDLATSTISRDRRDIPMEAWAFAEVAELIRGDELLRHALESYLDSAHGAAAADPKHLAADLAREVQATADLHGAVMAAQADGKIDTRERAQIRQRILDRQGTDAALLRDLDAMDVREGVRQ
jgi:hypothetical protein